MKRFRNLVFGLAIAAALCAADGNHTVVHMELQRGVTAWMGQMINFGLASGEKVIAAPGSQRKGTAPGVIVTAVSIENQPGAYRLTISPTDGGSVAAMVAPDKPAHVQLPRGVSGTLPYLDHRSLNIDTQNDAYDAPRNPRRQQASLKQSGMFWTVRGANAIIALRCCLLNGELEDYWATRRVA